MKHLILTGFMGCGKTTIGKLLVPRLKLPFVDLDEALTKKTGLSPQFYIPRYGIRAFRRLEKQLLREILFGPTIILSTGGGAILDRTNRRLMLRLGHVFWLYTPPFLLFERLEKEQNRPLLSHPFSINQLKQLFKEREPFYRQCHFKILNDFTSPKEVAIQIIRKYSHQVSCVMYHDT